MTVNVQIYYGEGSYPVKYAKPGDAGFDIRAATYVEIAGDGTAIVPTGLYMAIPTGYELQVRPRSGNSAKTSIRVANSPGTIDSSYRGEVGIIVDNRGGAVLKINAGDRVAQGVIAIVPEVRFEQVNDKETLGITERGENGFGSTGTN